jgi:16S rRNA (guanine527-N7)-methyltransferase
MRDRTRDGDEADQDDIAVSAHLLRGLEELAQPTSPQQLRQLTQLVRLLAGWSARINLTGHRDPITMATRLVLDAAALCRALPELPEAETLVDLGSGAGFPGLPISILHPHLLVRLIDSRLKRNHFQRAARRALDLANVEPILGRSDQLEVQPAEIVVAQAMAQPARALELMLPWASPGGMLVLPATEDAAQPEIPVGARFLEERRYQLPGLEIRRKLWIARASTH